MLQYCTVLLCCMAVRGLQLNRRFYDEISDSSDQIPEKEIQENDSLLEDKLRNLDDKFNQRLGQQIAFLRERIDRVENSLNSLGNALTHDWLRKADGSQIKLFERHLSWNAAQTVCHMYNSRLVSVDNDVKNLDVTEILHKLESGVDEAWIGLKTRTQMESADGKYSNFNEDYQVEGCAAVDRKGKWKIRSCLVEKPFVCEKMRPAEEADRNSLI